MEWIAWFIDLFVHLDKHLAELIRDYGNSTYLILVAVIFCETGLVVTPFLPGDSLLFAAGAFAGRGDLNPHLLFALLASAAIIGDNTNYAIGRFLGPRVLRDGRSRFLRKSHLDKTHAFFEKYGGKTIILARFVPIVRTFAPFVAGVGAMTYPKFLAFDICGGIIWVGVCVYAGVWFGGQEFVKNNFSLVALAIVFISVLPMLIEFWRHRRAAATPGDGAR